MCDTYRVVDYAAAVVFVIIIIYCYCITRGVSYAIELYQMYNSVYAHCTRYLNTNAKTVKKQYSGGSSKLRYKCVSCVRVWRVCSGSKQSRVCYCRHRHPRRPMMMSIVFG